MLRFVYHYIKFESLMRHFFCLACLALCLNSIAQTDNDRYVIDFITTQQGLSHNYVSSIVSDELNIKWIGTENGITKYNGYDFEYIKPGKDYPELLNENIEVLFKDKGGKLWIGTKSGGLASLDLQSNHMVNLNHLIDPQNKGDVRVTCMAEDKGGNIWVGTWSNGIFVVNYAKNELVRQISANTQIYSIANDFQGNVWYAIGQRLMMFDGKDTKTFQFKNYISDILPDPKRDLVWIATGGKNNSLLYSYGFSDNKIDSIQTGVVSEFTKKLFLDDLHQLWIGTWGHGIYKSNEDLSAFERINLVSGRPEIISTNYNNILSIHQDINKMIWLGTANGGLVRLIKGNGFKQAMPLIRHPDLKNNLNVIGIHKSNDLIFIGTVFNGIYFGEDFGHLSHIDQIGNVRVKALYENDGSLYIGTNDGYHIFDLKSRRIVFSSNSIKKVTSFLVDGQNLLIGTQELGLYEVNMSKMGDVTAYQRFYENANGKNVLESDRITGVKKDEAGNIWLSSYNGLHLYDRETDAFIHQSKLLSERLPSVIINSFDIKGKSIWLATPGGLFELLNNQGKLQLNASFTRNEGLNSDFICAVTFDDNDGVWFSTYTEIVKYDDKNKTMISYADVHGVKTTSFNNGSFSNYNKKELYFGGIDNITWFEPQEIQAPDTLIDVIFTNLRVNNKIISFQEGNEILDKDINYARSIELTHKDNFFSISFASNDFLGKLNVKYRYQLSGSSDEWIDLQNRNEINFAGLAAGNYQLMIEASRDGQHWSLPKAINITVLNSPWKSPMAILSYILLGLLIAFFIFRAYQIKLKLENRLEIARINKDKESELTEAKLNFFTNISHEFRTPLTLIVSPLKELMEQKDFPPHVIERLTYMDKNTSRLLMLINQLLDFRKADYGLLKLDVSYGNFVRFASEVFLYFNEMASAKHIKYSFKAEQDYISLPFDRDKMEIVLCNLLSNAIKYTHEGDSIAMEVCAEDGYCVIRIKDTGVGMDAENLEKIFDKFFQIKSGNTSRMVGSGIGLYFSKQIIDLHHGRIDVSSIKDEGTEFVVRLSMDADLYGDEINQNFLKSDDIKAYESIAPEHEMIMKTSGNKDASILIIDDNVDILHYLKNILSPDYHVLLAEDGDKGFALASSKIPDLIVSDVMMPGKDGIALCRQLKTQINTSHIPVILLTARTSTVFEVEGLKTGADDYVSKPFNANVIKARIASLLENRQKMRAHFLNKIRFEPTPQEVQEDLDTENSFIDQAIKLVEDNIANEAFGIEQMVETFYMSQSTLFRKIKSLTGLSLTAFIRSIRIKKAAHLILSTDQNLNQIAYEVGFNDYKYFKTSFKKQFGCLPSEYKEQMMQS